MNVNINTKFANQSADRLLSLFLDSKVHIVMQNGVVADGRLTGLRTQGMVTTVEIDGVDWCTTSKIKSLVIG